MKILQYKRKRERRTDYRKRLSLLKSKVPRFVVRKKNNSMVTQIVEYGKDGDHIIVTSTSNHLRKKGWKLHGSNLPSSYLVGFNCGILGIKKGVKKCILDARNTTTRRGSSTYAAAKGLIDAGINLNCNKEVFPTEERISGKHISDYAKSLKENYKERFSGYLKQGVSAEDITKNFEMLKKKLEGEK